jgi:flagellar hook-basal body complex protein FliE
MIDQLLSTISPTQGPTGAGSAGLPGAASGVESLATRRAAGVTVGEGPTADFTSVLAQVALDAVATLKTSEATSVAGLRGQAPVQQVVEAVMAAERTLQGAIAIRDKVVAAYLELSRMQI